MAASGVLKKFVASLLGGAAAGAGGAYIASPNKDERDLTSGALAGAAAGPLTYYAMKGLKHVVIDPLRWLGSDPRTKGATMKRSLRELSDLTGLDEMSTTDLRDELARLRGYGLKPTLADVGGESLRGAAEQAATVPGPARNVAVETLKTRQKAQKPFVERALADTLSPSADATGELARLQALKRADANTQYGAVYAQYPQLTSPELQKMVPALEHFDAFKLADDIAIARGEAPVDPANMGLRDWDLVKRGLDAKINMLAKKEGNDTLAREVGGLKTRYLAELDQLTTDPTGGSAYAAARNRFRELSTTQDAIEAGRDVVSMKPGRAADEALQDFANLSPADQAAFRIGLSRGLLDQVEAGKEGVGLVRNILDKRGDRLAKLFPDTASWEAFRDRLTASLNERELDYQVLGGSQTARRLGAADANAVKGVVPFLSAVRSHGNLSGGALQWALETLGHDPNELNRLTSEQLTKLLLNPDEAANAQTLKALDRHLLWESTKNVIKTGIIGAGTAGAAGGAGYLVGSPPEGPQGYAKGGLVSFLAKKIERNMKDLKSLHTKDFEPYDWEEQINPLLKGLVPEFNPDTPYDPRVQLKPKENAAFDVYTSFGNLVGSGHDPADVEEYQKSLKILNDLLLGDGGSDYAEGGRVTREDPPPGTPDPSAAPTTILPFGYNFLDEHPWGDPRLDGLTPEDVDQLLRELRQRKTSEAAAFRAASARANAAHAGGPREGALARYWRGVGERLDDAYARQAAEADVGPDPWYVGGHDVAAGMSDLLGPRVARSWRDLVGLTGADALATFLDPPAPGSDLPDPYRGRPFGGLWDAAQVYPPLQAVGMVQAAMEAPATVAGAPEGRFWEAFDPRPALFGHPRDPNAVALTAGYLDPDYFGRKVARSDKVPWATPTSDPYVGP